MRIAVVIPAACSIVIASCQTTEGEGVSDSLTARLQPSYGEHLSEALCSGCHAIAEGEISPNPEAPGFVEVADRKGLTREMLGNFLHDSYDFPNQMNLELSDEDADAIAAYILTLRSGEK